MTLNEQFNQIKNASPANQIMARLWILIRFSESEGWNMTANEFEAKAIARAIEIGIPENQTAAYATMVMQWFNDSRKDSYAMVQ